jgi:hypothetical protein
MFYQALLSFLVFQIVLSVVIVFDSILESHFYSELSDLSAVIRDTGREIILYSMPVKAHAKTNSRFSDNSLLLGISKEFKHIFVLLIIMDTVVANIHFPKYVLLRHSLEIAIWIFSKRGNKRKHIRMSYAYIFASASLGKAEQISACRRVIGGKALYQAVIEERDIGILGQGCFDSRGVGRNLKTA